MSRERDDAFRAFVVAWSPALLRTAFLLTGDRGHAEDLLQAVLLKTARRWHRLDRHDTAYAYVRKALVNTHISWHRRRRVPERLIDRVDEPAPASHDHFAPADRTAAALAALPPGMRAVLVLRFFEDLSEVQTAAALGCSVGNVKSQAARGLAKLRVQLDRPDDAGATTRGRS